MVPITSSKPLSYYVLHGFLGGKLHSRGLRRTLRNRGYSAALSAEKADIIIAHSGGSYYLLQAGFKPKLLLLVAPALPRTNPRAIFNETRRQLWQTARHNHYLRKRLLWSLGSFGYALVQPRRNLRMLHAASDMSLAMPAFAGTTVVFITNRHDPWPQGPQLQRLLKNPWAFMSLPGAHEHIWEHPQHYVEILEHYARLLA